MCQMVSAVLPALRDLEEMTAERGLCIDHSTIGRWVLHYAPELNKRNRRDVRKPNGCWRVDETYVRVGGAWIIYIGQSIPWVIRSILSCRRSAMRWQRSTFCRWHCDEPVACDHESSTSMAMPPIHKQFRSRRQAAS